MSQDKSLATRNEQPLSGTAITEMTQRETWNKKHPPVEATIVKDLKTTELVAREYRGTKARFYRLSGAIRLQPHLSELPAGKASVKHRHTTEAVLYIVKGKGYSLMWPEGEKPQRYDWHEGTVISPPAGSWHQHYNTGNQPCKFVALHANTAVQGEEQGVEQGAARVTVSMPDQRPRDVGFDSAAGVLPNDSAGTPVSLGIPTLKRS